MSARSKARKRALDVLFEADSRGVPIPSVLAEHVRRRRDEGSPELNEYTVALVEGVSTNQATIDDGIERSAVGWSLDRMPDVDRAIARVAAFEILFVEEVPDAVAISEAVDLATDLSTAESPRFIAGLLHAISAEKSGGSVSSE